MLEAYPLNWPMGWPRTKYRESSRLARYPFGQARDDVYRELERLGATNVIISSNLATRLDGIPRSGQRAPDDTGIAVYFDLNGRNQCIPCDKWYSVEQNLRAIAKTIEALRGIERWGAKEMVDAAFRGFEALPESVVVPPQPWYVVLEIESDADKETIRAAYTKLAKLHHPDYGGTDEDFNRIKKAYEEGINHG